MKSVLETKPPRIIQGRQPEYNLEIMRFLRPFEHWFYHQNDHIVKGLNPIQRAARIQKMYDKYPKGRSYNIDNSKHDSHVSQHSLKMEHACYNAMHNNHPTLKMLLKWQLNNVGTTPWGWTYTTKGRRASGDFNTGLGNTMICVCLLDAYIKYRQLDCDYVIDGDDVELVTEMQIDEIDIRNFYLMCGYEITLVPDELMKGTHCQSKFIPTKIPIMVRRPEDVVSKGLTSQKYFWDEKCRNNFLHNLGQCELALNRGVPVLQEYAQMLIRLHPKTNNKDYSDEYLYRRKQAVSLGKQQPEKVTIDARCQFEDVFNIDITMQLRLETRFKAMTRTPFH